MQLFYNNEVNKYMKRILEMRRKLKIETYECIKLDSHHKSAEGAISITCSIAPVVSHSDGLFWTIEVYSYLLCPDGRRDSKCGTDFNQVLTEVESMVDYWVSSSESDRWDRADDETDAYEQYLETLESRK